MLELVIAGAAYALDLILSFMTDGYWKTAGSGIAYLYWNRNSGRRWKTKTFPRPSGICGTSWVSAAELYGIQGIECLGDVRIPSRAGVGCGSMEVQIRLDTRQRMLASPVFSKPERRRFVAAFLAAALLILAGAFKSKGAELAPETLKSWDAYVQTQNARVAQYSSATTFLWSDQSPDGLRRLHNGDIVVAPFGENPHRVPQGLIHHWIGAVFLPGARLDDVFSVVRDYDTYKDLYAPNIIESRLVQRTETEDTFSLRILNNAVIGKFALDTDFQGSYKQLDKHKWYSTSYTTRVREVENCGAADEHQVPADIGRGLMWRLYSTSRFEERDRGVYIELEAVALSRDIPGALRWLVDPVVRRTSRNSMIVSLQKTQGAVFETSRSAKDNENEKAPAKSALRSRPTAPVRSGSNSGPLQSAFQALR
jgi:hypothetical protein